MPYSYKLGNDGPHLPEVPDNVTIKGEVYKKGGAFSNAKWELSYEKPGSKGIAEIRKSMISNGVVGKIVW